jgi:cold shock CspA family protein
MGGEEHRVSNRKQRDETLYCERCGIAFLWPVEEQRATLTEGAPNKAPTHCPGCRHLLPAPGRERGEVKFYNARKQFGFLTRRTGGELFVHGSALTARQRLSPGDLVEYSIIETERGPAATDLVVLEKGEQPRMEKPTNRR